MNYHPFIYNKQIHNNSICLILISTTITKIIPMVNDDQKIVVGSIITLLLVVIFVILPAFYGFPYSFGNKGSDKPKLNTRI